MLDWDHQGHCAGHRGVHSLCQHPTHFSSHLVCICDARVPSPTDGIRYTTGPLVSTPTVKPASLIARGMSLSAGSTSSPVLPLLPLPFLVLNNRFALDLPCGDTMEQLRKQWR